MKLSTINGKLTRADVSIQIIIKHLDGSSNEEVSNMTYEECWNGFGKDSDDLMDIAAELIDISSDIIRMAQEETKGK